MALVDRFVLRGSIHLGSRSHDDTGGAMDASAFQHVQGADDIGVDIRMRHRIAVGNRNQRSEMQNDLPLAHQAMDEGRIADVTPDNLKGAAGLDCVEPSS